MSKIRPCSCKTCNCRRINFERPDVMRKHVKVDVPDDYPEDQPVFCSIECKCYYDSEKNENGEGNNHE